MEAETLLKSPIQRFTMGVSLKQNLRWNIKEMNENGRKCRTLGHPRPTSRSFGTLALIVCLFSSVSSNLLGESHSAQSASEDPAAPFCKYGPGQYAQREGTLPTSIQFSA